MHFHSPARLPRFCRVRSGVLQAGDFHGAGAVKASDFLTMTSWAPWQGVEACGSLELGSASLRVLFCKADGRVGS